MAEPSTPLSQDQIAYMIRMESIFQPETRKRREEKRVADNSAESNIQDQGKFAHYTSAEAALSILRSKRLWMRSSTCMADYREINHGYDMLRQYFQLPGKKAAFLAAMDAVHAGAAEAAANIFDKWWNNIKVNTFITSVSEHDAKTEDQIGRLSMWRAFGGTQTRVALVVSMPWYSQAALSLGLLFSPVVYVSEPKMYEMLDTVVQNVTREVEFLKHLAAQEFQNWLFGMMLSSVYCAKHQGFWEEREWRAVYTHGFGTPSLLQREVENIGGVPQPVFKIPLDTAVSESLADLDITRILDRVIIGPTQFAWVVYEAFVDALTAAGVPDAGAKVWTSNLPIRG
jgi:hypothetical protein